jgi:predicted DNA-binding transcriptional regulator YafY
MTKRERFSKQLARVLMILERLRLNGNSTIMQAYEHLRKSGIECSSRTVARDLATLEACGFVEREESLEDGSFVYGATGNVASGKERNQ